MEEGRSEAQSRQDAKRAGSLGKLPRESSAKKVSEKTWRMWRIWRNASMSLIGLVCMLLAHLICIRTWLSIRISPTAILSKKPKSAAVHFDSTGLGLVEVRICSELITSDARLDYIADSH